MSVHDKIRRFRLSREMTHQQLADAVGVSRGAVQQWESGATAPTRKNQPTVAAYMGITVDELMAVDTHPPAIAQAGQLRGGDLFSSLMYLTDYLQGLDPSDRKAAMVQIASLVDEPERCGKVVASIEAMAATGFAQSGKKAA